MTIGLLARRFGLSRSTLLYYDRIGLLKPSGRSGAGYRRYTDRDAEELARICLYRQTGLSLEGIRALRGGEQGLTVLPPRRSKSNFGASHIRWTSCDAASS